MKKLLLIVLGCCFTLSCDKDLLGPQKVNANEGDLIGRKVLILNEGNFQRNNSSISCYKPKFKTLVDQVYSSKNSRPLGDVAQDLALYQDKYLISLNNSKRLELIDTGSFISVGRVENLDFPTYISIYQDKAFVSDLFSAKMYSIDLETLVIEKEIPLSRACSYSTLWNNKIAAIANNRLLIIDPILGIEDSSLIIAPNLGRPQIDQNNQLWILAKNGASSKLIQLNTDLSIAKELNFTTDENPKLLEISADSKTLFYSSNTGVYSQSIFSNQLDKKLIISHSRDLYGFNVDPKTSDFYLSDALSFDESSLVFRYDSLGQLVDSFNAGRISNSFHFSN